MLDRSALRNEDRLPWLETVESDGRERSNIGRLIALTLLGLALLGGIVFGIVRWQTGRSVGGGGKLIEAQLGDYKVRPDDAGGLKVEGEGDAAVATSAGARSDGGAVDLKAVPEAPVTALPGPRSQESPTPDAGRNAVAPVPASGGQLIAAMPMSPSRINVPGAAGGGSLVQLGAFPTQASATTAWGTFAKRFGYISALGKSVQAAEVDGRTVHRLRVNAGSANQAADICGRLRVAGEACFVTS